MKEKMLSLCFSPSCSIPISLVSFVCGVSWFFKFAAHSKRFCLCFYFSPLFSVVDSSRQCPAEVIVSTAAASSSFLLLKNHMVVNLKYWLRWIFFFSIFFIGWVSSFVFIRSEIVFPFRLHLLDALSSAFVIQYARSASYNNVAQIKWTAMGMNILLKRYM